MVQQATYQGAQPPQPAPDRPASSPNYPSPQQPEEIPALRPTRIDGSQIPPNLANVWTLPQAELVVEEEGETPLAWEGARLSALIGDFLEQLGIRPQR